ncbi:MAG TPA: serine/threonine-protein kinase, partial [Nannocystaceae bacterium]|nr:serine/threonine-protein kinase [Nannocystaceae bacterium]
MRLGDEVGGRFRLVRRAGAGGMGVVFHADDLERGGPVAVKIVAGSALELERFTREAEVLAGIDDPRIVRYLAHGAHGDARYLALEWLDGEDLSRRLARGPMDEDEVLRLAHGLAEALAVLHARGVVHRDIKPSNVFLVGGSVDAVKLLDLGVARDLSGGLGLTATGATIGTPAYMAPEQARGEPVDARADLFALGCLLFESLTGRTPFHAAPPIAAPARLLFEDAPRLGDSPPDLGAAPPGL